MGEIIRARRPDYMIQESYMRIFQEILGVPRISYTSIFRRIRRIKVPGSCNPASLP